ncbi:1985_t:CDS:2 [Paraglomus brasilianum]|uniref:1985_t:CDS:1 n=1 Tax=Paraglomus brasilianum TaxID=144538 RepID=A0A9N9G3K4_9GLOM|nr:1985_t:CDS:2 [Paraglomus brasilianum]
MRNFILLLILTVAILISFSSATQHLTSRKSEIPGESRLFTLTSNNTGKLVCPTGTFKCKDKAGRCCPDGTECLPYAKCGGKGNDTGGNTGGNKPGNPVNNNVVNTTPGSDNTDATPSGSDGTTPTVDNAKGTTKGGDEPISGGKGGNEPTSGEDGVSNPVKKSRSSSNFSTSYPKSITPLPDIRKQPGFFPVPQ